MKLLLGIFAHPDDEAFGPSGALIKEVRENSAELHLVTLTLGENGMNPDGHEDLAAVREREWREAGQIIGAKHMHALGYIDGTLGNIDMLQAADTIMNLVRDTYNADVHACIEFMTMDTNGISGHVDHIVASRAAHLAYYRLKSEGLPMEQLRTACIPRERTGDEPNVDFVYMEPGRLDTEIDETVDATAYIDDVRACMRAHHTQRSDGETHLEKRGDRLAVSHFIVKR